LREVAPGVWGKFKREKKGGVSDRKKKKLAAIFGGPKVRGGEEKKTVSPCGLKKTDPGISQYPK